MTRYLFIILLASFVSKFFFDASALLRILFLTFMVVSINLKKFLSKPILNYTFLTILLIAPFLVGIPKNINMLFLQLILIYLLLFLANGFTKEFNQLSSKNEKKYIIYLLIFLNFMFFIFFPFQDQIPEILLSTANAERQDLVKSRYLVPSLFFNNPRVLARFIFICFLFFLMILILNSSKGTSISKLDFFLILLTLVVLILLGRRSLILIASFSTILFFILINRISYILLMSFILLIAFLFLLEFSKYGSKILQIFLDLNLEQIKHRIYDVFFARLISDINQFQGYGLFSSLINEKIRHTNLETGLGSLIRELGYFFPVFIFIFVIKCCFLFNNICRFHSKFFIFYFSTWFLVFSYFLLRKGQILYSFEAITFYLISPALLSLNKLKMKFYEN
ncbi:MAG: hypothetical protein CBB97_07630 [Candidatus Endolissoclinum sp. TMED37]|nr:MAG: hypothetical protein CBB97_07630 [Candidatus Endolissoclinum sp. TMED37]